jgi:hypothetical protein
MAGNFNVNYNAGGVVDEVKKVKIINEVELIDDVANVEVVEDVKLVEEVKLVDEVKEVDLVDEVKMVDEVALVDEVKKVDEVEKVDEVDNVKNVDEVKIVDEIGKIRGFASKLKPYNTMKMFEVPALKGNYYFTMTLPPIDVEILAITLTCSGYGEDDHYDVYFNGDKWFEDWYCSEVKEGLFLGTSTYIYAAPANSEIKLVFKNDSGTTKKIWLGVRMLT